MDFSFGEEQQAVAETAGRIFSTMATSERVGTIEATDDRFDSALWDALAGANLLGLAVPEEFGGSGLGLVELCLVLEEQGRAVAPVPLWATTVLGAMPLARFGTDQQKQALLPGVVSGRHILSAALADFVFQFSDGSTRDRSRRGRPCLTAEPRGDHWILNGLVHAVPQAHLATAVLVPARVEGGTAVFVVDPSDQTVTLERASTTDRQVHPHLRFDDTSVADQDVLATPPRGSEVVDWILERARTGLCALALGVCEEAVRRAAVFLNDRHQFGKPLSSFQATMLRAADAFIDTEAMRVTLWHAAWRIDTGRDAHQAVASAHWWASDAGQRIVHATQHLHGGIGADVEYPIHRYFLWGKQIELMLGAPTSELARLGALVAQSFNSRAQSSVSSGGAD